MNNIIRPGNKRYQGINSRYEAAFGYNIPCKMAPNNLTLDLLEKQVNRCISENKDMLVELWGIDITREDIIWA